MQVIRSVLKPRKTAAFVGLVVVPFVQPEDDTPREVP